MSLKRSYRLRLIQCYLDVNQPDRLIPLSKYSDQERSLISSWNTSEDILRGLKAQDVISSIYSERCLEVDVWFLSKSSTMSFPVLRECPTVTDIEGKLLFQVVFQSLLDFRAGRPCDLDVWKKDVSPDFRCCTHSHHLCWNSAEKYLLGLDPEVEEYIGLSPGFISGLLSEMRKNILDDQVLETSFR